MQDLFYAYLFFVCTSYLHKSWLNGLTVSKFRYNLIGSLILSYFYSSLIDLTALAILRCIGWNQGSMHAGFDRDEGRSGIYGLKYFHI